MVRKAIIPNLEYSSMGESLPPSSGLPFIPTMSFSHYDVISAPLEGWTSDPFTLTGRNGYLYARGVTDNKGPIMAVACAAAELLRRRALGLDLVFLIEGEEECGSAGFGQAVRKHKVCFGWCQLDVLAG
jgi:acetylornithine deacetylase/succinyl-diaminopimelate desuccinylase-like protein